MNILPVNVPPELAKIYEENGCNIRALERTLKTNRFYIWRLIRQGIEPTDKTEKGRKARVALFLPRHKHKKRKTPEIPEYVRRWRRLPKEVRHRAMKQFVDWYEKDINKEKMNAQSKVIESR